MGENKNDTIALLESKLQKASQENDGTLRRSLEKSRSEQTILQSKYEGAKQRNRILDEEVEHYKSVNCQLEDDVADWKERASIGGHSTNPTLLAWGEPNKEASACF